MKKGRMILMLAAAGLLATTAAAAGAAGLTEKVTGLLRKDVSVVVDGAVTGMQPVFIDGKAYLPAREAAAELGYELTWNAGDKSISLRDQAGVVRDQGVMEKVSEQADGSVSFEFLGKTSGDNKRIVLHADSRTAVVDAEGKAVDLRQLKPGTSAAVEYGPVVTDSVPPSAEASRITVGPVRLVREDVIGDVQIAEGDARIVFGAANGDQAFTPDLVLNLGKETSVVTPQGQSAPWSELKAGVKVRSYYGPALLKSMPPQSPADIIVILGPEGTAK